MTQRPIPVLPKPKISGIGHVRYRCASCGALMEPEHAVFVGDRTYHPDHLPETTDGR